MKKSLVLFISGLLISITFLEGAVRVISPLLGPPLSKWNTMEDAKILKLQEFRLNYQDPHYVFMGNSTTLIGVNPSVFDIESKLPPGSSFNAAMNGSEIKQIRDFACGYIIKNVNPKNLVILFSNVGMASDTDYVEQKTNSSSIGMYSYIYRYRNTFRDPMTINTFMRIAIYRDTRQGLVYRWADNLDDFGYTKYATSNSAIINPGWDPNRSRNFQELSLPRIDARSMKYLKEIRDYTLVSGGRLIIGTVPTLTFDPVYRGAIEEMAKYLGVGFVQGNDALGEGKYFQDEVHLNQMGATTFSKFLSSELAKLR